MAARGEKVKPRLFFLREECLAGLANANDDVRAQVQQLVDSGGQEMPDYLREADADLTEEELNRFVLNHKRHM